jgi:two-component system response regulator AtoC
MSELQHGLIGNSPAMAEVIDFIATVAGSNATVLIQGETGTGKDLVAQAIHSNSRRSKRPFVAVNCAAFSEGLIENELFGHEKEAFTGALSQKKGRFEHASGGTLFLDEIAELHLSVQAKLLRVIEQREVDRLGGAGSIPIDVRLIVATHRDLKSAVAAGEMREDFYYRMKILSVKLPPLRERREDIPVLVRHFFSKYENETPRQVLGISSEADDLLRNYDWPGNVRELQNAMITAIVIGKTDFIQPQDFATTILSNAAAVAETEFETLDQAILATTRQFVLKVFEKVKGDHQKAAAILRRHANGLNRFLDRIDLPQLKKRRGPWYGTT